MNSSKVYPISRREFLLSTMLLGLSYKLLANTKERENHFQHGVASGDPLQDRIILWTRVTARRYHTKLVKWEVSADKSFTQIVQQGEYTLSPTSDYTVKTDVSNLTPGTTYYYRFRYNGHYSTEGTTRTLPERLNGGAFQIGVVSCNNWEDGYFNAFRFLSQKQAVDLVLHLGDYIYEYATGRYGNPAVDRVNDPKHEIVTLDDYRKRYALYHTDPDLQLLHASKPFCIIWDDHEIANDAYTDGAKNHQEDEGDWTSRRQAAVQAYLEWLPVRAKNVIQMRRKLSIGDDLELYLLENRLQGRTIQMNREAPEFNNDDRSLLGSEQYEWLTTNLKQSKATWKLLGNQVMFSGYAVASGFKLPKYNDWWLGYPNEREALMRFFEEERISNPVFLTGDHHKAFVLALHHETEFMKYTKPFEERPMAWELLTPSITSKNADRLSSEEIKGQEAMLHQKEINPHLVYADIKSHGYYIASINKKQLRADYYYTDNILNRNADEYKASSFTINAETFVINTDLY